MARLNRQQEIIVISLSERELAGAQMQERTDCHSKGKIAIAFLLWEVAGARLQVLHGLT